MSNLQNRQPINLLLCGNPDAEYVLPTQIRSVLSNTDRYVHVRIITRNWDASDFETDNLKVEFINYQSDQYGWQPQCNATLDRLFYLKEMDDWDRCIMNDWDQLALRDVGELMDHEFEEGKCYTAMYNYRRTFATTPQEWVKHKRDKLFSRLESDDLRSHHCWPLGGNLIDLKKARSFGLLDKIRDDVKALNGQDHLSQFATFAGYAQDVGDRYNHLLPNCYKDLNTRARDESVQLHYNKYKPWNKRKISPTWHNYACNWADLRPLPSERDLAHAFPLMVFAMPRTGSTLLLRLLNKCTTATGMRVRMNGEQRILFELQSLFDSHYDMPNVTRPTDLKFGSFTPFLHNNHLSSIAYGILQLLRSLTGSGPGEVYGFKQVDYGFAKGDKFKKLVCFLDTHLRFKFIFLTRDIEDVQKSMQQRKGWWKPHRMTKPSLETQQRNFKSAASLCRHAINMDYKALLEYSSFVSAVEPYGLTIKKTDHDYEIARKIKKR